jgi:HlyD family secretion protein
VLSLLTLAACSGENPTPVATALVTRATITNAVRASGSLSAITTQNLGFGKGGQLTSVSVKVGDQVSEGETLAKIDDFALKQNVTQQQANLRQQEAALGRLVQNPALSGGNSTLKQARAILAATQRQVRVTKTADMSAIRRAKKQLKVDQDAQDQSEDLQHTVQKACDASKGDTSSSVALSTLAARATQLLQAGDTAGANAVLSELTLALHNSTADASASACSAVLSSEAAVTAAKQRVTASRTAVVAAEQKEKVDEAAGQLSVANSRQAVVAAKNNVSVTGSDRQFTIDQQRALVTTAQALLDSAKKDLQDATLKAPFAGTVSAINGTVGEFLPPSTGTTALAPGSRAAIPGTDTAGGAAGGLAAVTRPGGSQFLVISNINRLQVVLPFEESDAARIRAKQKASVGFDAVPGLTRSGTVSSVAPTSTAISGVINYYVTVRLDSSDPRLRDGQSARVTVITGQRQNVLSVPNGAVHRQGAVSAVIVVDALGNQRTVTFKPGVVGSERTEVLSGLEDGQRVVTSTGH